MNLSNFIRCYDETHHKVIELAFDIKYNKYKNIMFITDNILYNKYNFNYFLQNNIKTDLIFILGNCSIFFYDIKDLLNKKTRIFIINDKLPTDYPIELYPFTIILKNIQNKIIDKFFDIFYLY